jgi:hypothetical protein
MTSSSPGEAGVPAPEFRVARVFDFADPQTGPGFAPDHAVIENLTRREELAGYLRGGHPVLVTTMRMDDVVDPAAGPAVPGSFRTDGEWIWTESVEYYLSRHGLAPDAELTAHIQARLDRGQPVPDTNRDTATRAAEFMLHPPADQARTAVWSPGASAADPADHEGDNR